MVRDVVNRRDGAKARYGSIGFSIMDALWTIRRVLRHDPKSLPRKVLRTWSERGWKGLLAGLIDVFRRRTIDEFYSVWIQRYDTLTEEGRQSIREEISKWATSPLISTIMSVHNIDLRSFEATIGSISTQLYQNWELCIFGDARMPADVKDELTSLVQRDDRICVGMREESGSLCADLNRALAAASGEFIVLFDCNDLIPEHAFYWVAKELIAHPNTDLIFSDEDKIDHDGARFDPYFKPDWNPSLMLSRNAFGHLAVFRRSLVEKVGGFRSEFVGGHVHDLVLRCVRETRADRIRHIPRVLFHRRTRKSAIAAEVLATGCSWEAGKRAIDHHLGRCGVRATVRRACQSSYQVDYALPASLPRVSIVLPSTGNAELLGPCLQSVLTTTTYVDFEILLLISDRHQSVSHKFELLAQFVGDPRVRVLKYPDRPFNYSRVNNWGAAHASGSVLCFLNDDTVVITPDWLERLVARVSLPKVAVAGAMLFYPDDTIQHAGVILGLGGVAGHACHGQARGSCGYANRACLEQDVSCVSAACMAIRATLFRDLGGFDEKLAIAYNDVDLCVRVRRAGWRIIWTPTVELYHRESASTGRHDSRKRADQFAREVALMKARWGMILDSDPYYSPNLSLMRESELAFPPRRPIDFYAKCWPRKDSGED